MKLITVLSTLVLLFHGLSAPTAAQDRCRRRQDCEEGLTDLTTFSRRQMATWIWAQYGEPELTRQHQEMLRNSLEYGWYPEGTARARASAGKYYPTPTQIADTYMYLFAYEYPGDVDELRASIIAWESVQVTQDEIDGAIADYFADPKLCGEACQRDPEIFGPNPAVLETRIHTRKFWEENTSIVDGVLVGTVPDPRQLTMWSLDLPDMRPYSLVSQDRPGAVAAALMLNVLAEYERPGGP